MKKSLIAMTSITYAMKAKNLLNSLKYYCEIQRTPKDLGTGCGYPLTRTATPDLTVTAILEKERIPFRNVIFEQKR